MKSIFKILYYSSQFPTPVYPTAGMFSLQRVRALTQIGCEVLVVCPVVISPPLNYLLKPIQAYRLFADQVQCPSEYSMQGVRVNYPKWLRPPKVLFGWYSSLFLFLQTRSTITRIAKYFQPEIILSSWLPDGVAACLLGDVLGIPTIAIADGSDVNIWPRQYLGWNFACDLLNKKASTLVFVSESLRSKGQSMGLYGKKSAVLYNAADVNLFVPRESISNHKIYRILSVGRLVSVKGFQVLLEAFAEFLARVNGQTELVIVGEGPQRNELIEQAAARKISASVQFAGEVEHDQLVRYYQDADLVCIPSFFEGSPSVLFEAMACGIPVVATSVGGIPEILDAEAGMLVPPGEPHLLCEALILAKNKLWDKQSIRNKIVKDYDWGNWTRSMIEIFNTSQM